MGGSSLSEGQVCVVAAIGRFAMLITRSLQIEVMVHRRLLQDDNLGVMEPLNETDVGCSPYPTQVPDWTSLCAPLPSCIRSGTGIVSRGLLMLTLEPPERAARVWRPLAHMNYMQVSVELLNLCQPSIFVSLQLHTLSASSTCHTHLQPIVAFAPNFSLPDPLPPSIGTTSSPPSPPLPFSVELLTFQVIFPPS